MTKFNPLVKKKKFLQLFGPMDSQAVSHDCSDDRTGGWAVGPTVLCRLARLKQACQVTGLSSHKAVLPEGAIDTVRRTQKLVCFLLWVLKNVVKWVARGGGPGCCRGPWGRCAV